MHRIGKRYTFDAAHHLPGLPAGHKCSRVHGHTYTAEFILASEALTPPGFVADFADLTPVRDYIGSALDHRDLNEVLDRPPTCEAIAEHLADWYRDHLTGTVPGRLEAVRVWETPTSWAEYTPDAA
jgi:6-pyruvoyltetrahydropterin/6-carboxytetrahydropterin synthase